MKGIPAIMVLALLAVSASTAVSARDAVTLETCTAAGLDKSDLKACLRAAAKLRPLTSEMCSAAGLHETDLGICLEVSAGARLFPAADECVSQMTDLLQSWNSKILGVMDSDDLRAFCRHAAQYPYTENVLRSTGHVDRCTESVRDYYHTYVFDSDPHKSVVVGHNWHDLRAACHDITAKFPNPDNCMTVTADSKRVFNEGSDSIDEVYNVAISSSCDGTVRLNYSYVDHRSDGLELCKSGSEDLSPGSSRILPKIHLPLGNGLRFYWCSRWRSPSKHEDSAGYFDCIGCESKFDFECLLAEKVAGSPYNAFGVVALCPGHNRRAHSLWEQGMYVDWLTRGVIEMERADPGSTGFFDSAPDE